MRKGGGAPATGDTGVALYAACGLLAAGAVSVLVLRRKRETKLPKNNACFR